VLALFGTPDTIQASVRADRDRTAIEDAFDITLGYKGSDGKGLLAHCRTSYLACDNAPRFLMHGTKGSFRKYGLDPQEPALEGGAKVPVMGSQEVWLKENSSKWGVLTVAPDPVEPGILVMSEVETEPGDYRGFYANVREAVLGTAALAVTADDGYRVIKLLEMARESSEKGCRLTVELSSI
jgi:scyllo-inositol 2-dehydrogenase (NADP+)